MGENSDIEWTDHTFNPWIGCTKVSPGCMNCYAEKHAERYKRALWGQGKPRQRTKTWNEPLRWNRDAVDNGRRRRVFCASLADVFDAEIDPRWRVDLWALIRQTPALDWLLLTKRPENIKSMLPPDWGDGWANVCLMTSVEDQKRTERIKLLIEIPARFRALSIEPLLGPVAIESEWMKHLDWVIVGGESQRGARPMHPEWARALRQQCAEQKVRFFFKQWGCWSPNSQFANASWSNAVFFESPHSSPVYFEELNPTEREKYKGQAATGTFLFRTTKNDSGALLDDEHYKNHPPSFSQTKK